MLLCEADIKNQVKAIAEYMDRDKKLDSMALKAINKIVYTDVR